MNKQLYFEGLGWPETGGAVGNCHIGTAFTNDDGKKIYLQLGGREIYDKKNKPTGEFQGCMQFCFYIIDEDMRYISKMPWLMKYTKETILENINNHLNCSFSEMIVSPYLSGFIVSTDNGSYNMGDEFQDTALAIENTQPTWEQKM